MAIEGVTDDEFIVEKGWTHKYNRDDWSDVWFSIPFILIVPSILFWFIHPLISIGWLIITGLISMSVIRSHMTQWRPWTIRLSPRQISIEGASKDTTIQFDDTSSIDVPYLKIDLDCPEELDIEGRNELGKLEQIPVVDLIEGIMFKRKEDSIYLTCNFQGWKREDIESLWRATCHILSVNNKIIIGENLRCLILHLQNDGAQ